LFITLKTYPQTHGTPQPNPNNNNKNKEYKLKTIARVILLGIVGNDPDCKQSKSGMPVVSFPVATMAKRKSPNGDPVDVTLWHNVVAFGKQADNIQKIVAKGSKIYIDGTIDYQEYQDNQGNKKMATKIICNDFSAVSKSEYQQSKAQLESVGNKKTEDDFFSDIPF
jgi:single-strand DNA-binding protein